MTMSLLEKARAGRLAALKSLETISVKSNAVVLPFDLEFEAKQEKAVPQFVSHRAKPQADHFAVENLFAA